MLFSKTTDIRLKRGRRGLRTRSWNIWVIECSISSNGDLRNKISQIRKGEARNVVTIL